MATWNALKPYRSQLPDLKKIIVWGDDVSHNSDDVLSWEEIMKLGMDCTNESVLARQRNMAINQCCVLMYTSGTTGPPKGSSIITLTTIKAQSSKNGLL